MNNLALTYWNQGKHKEAEELHVRVLELRQTVLGAEHPGTLTSMHNLAFTYRSQGRLKEAIEMMQQVVVLSTMVLGSHHPHTVDSAQVLKNWTGPFGGEN